MSFDIPTRANRRDFVRTRGELLGEQPRSADARRPDRVIRGGSFSNSAIGVRGAARDGADTPEGFGFIGFRVAISAPSP